MTIEPIRRNDNDGFQSQMSLRDLREALQEEQEIHECINLLSYNTHILSAFLILTPERQEDVLRGIDQQITTASANMGGDNEEGRRQKKRHEHFSRLKERLLRIQSNAQNND